MRRVGILAVFICLAPLSSLLFRGWWKYETVEFNRGTMAELYYLLNNSDNNRNTSTSSHPLETPELLWGSAFRSPYPSFGFSMEVTEQKQTEGDRNRRPCRVVLENKFDFHYELLESVVLRYPLPWNEFHACSTYQQPVEFVIAHANRDALNNNNPGELDGWRQYFQTQLAGTVRTRADGVKARFGSAMHWSDHQRREKEYHKQQQQQKIVSDTYGSSSHSAYYYDAYIGVSCGSEPTRYYLDRGPNHFCLLHVDCASDRTCNDTARTCRPNPVDDRCFFLPLDLPRTAATATNKCPPQQQTPAINLCTIGSGRAHWQLANALQYWQKHQPGMLQNVVVTIHKRGKTADVPKWYKNDNIQENNSTIVRVVHRAPFVAFARSVAQCDVILPLVIPEYQTGYFLPSQNHSNGGGGKLSGCLAQAMAYQIPTVLHEQLYAIYGPYLAQSSRTYRNDQTFRQALGDMVGQLRFEAAAQRDPGDCRSSTAVAEDD